MTMSSYMPGNGSLFEQRVLFYAVYPGNEYDQQLNLTIFPSNLASLAFNSNVIDTSGNLELVATLLDPNRIRIQILCSYPLSGQYDTLSRALFYVLLVLSLVFRRHVWISVAALGTAMTYAAVAAVHLFALIANFKFKDGTYWNVGSSELYGDVDFLGILAILQASAIMLTPILMWSTSVRRHRAQAVIIYWGILIFSASITALVYDFRSWERNEIPSFASCARVEGCGGVPEDFELTTDYYSCSKCIDFYGTFSPSAPMRQWANMVPDLSSSFVDHTVERDGFQNLYMINTLVLFFVVANGILALLQSRCSQEEVRNAIFRALNSDARTWIILTFEGQCRRRILSRLRMEDPDTRQTKWKKCRYFFAKGVAGSFFMLAALQTLLCPALFLTSVVLNEFVMQYLPRSEHSDAVGAWGTWVGAALVLIATIIDRYHGAWMKSMLVPLEAVWRVFKWAKGDRPVFHAVDRERSAPRRTKLFFLEIVSPLVHGVYSTRRAWWTAMTTLKFFRAWCKDTKVKSHQIKDEISDAWLDAETRSPGGKPVCQCRMCEVERESKKCGSRSGEAERNAQFGQDDLHKHAGSNYGDENELVQRLSEELVPSSHSIDEEQPDWSTVDNHSILPQ